MPTRGIGAWWSVGKWFLQAAVIALVVYVVWNEVAKIDPARVAEQVRDADRIRLAAGLLAAFISIAVLALYDVVSFHTLPTLSPRRRWVLGMGMYAWTNLITLGPIGIPALRLLVYRRYAMPAPMIARGVGRLYTGSFSGLGAWAIAAVAPLGSGPMSIGIRTGVAVALSVIFSLGAGFILARVRHVGDDLSTPGTYLRLGLIGAIDWALVLGSFALVCTALHIPKPIVELAETLFAGFAVGLVSMMPGGAGTADAAWLTLFVRFGIDASTAAAAIVLYRAIYYLMPWFVANIALSAWWLARLLRPRA